MNDVKVATTFVILSSKQNLTLPHHFFFLVNRLFCKHSVLSADSQLFDTHLSLEP